MSSNSTAIRVRDLSKLYRIAHENEKHTTLAETLLARMKHPLRRAAREEFWALRDVNFEVKKGDVVGIIGRNGAGKSTLLKVLSRITEPTAGKVELYGRVGSLLEVGTGFHPELTGRENIYLNGAILGMRRTEIGRQFDAIVAFSEVEQFLDTPVKRYSSGMYVRLAFAVAAHLNPEILIVDEVLAVGDAQFQKKCLGKMQDVAEGGRTVLFVSHNMGTVRALCTRAIWMTKGAVHLDGPADDVLDHYTTTGVAAVGERFDAARSPRVGMHGQLLKITTLALNDGQPVRHGESLRVRFGYQSTAPVDDVSFSIGFCSMDGTRLVTVDTDFGSPRKTFGRAATGEVQLSLRDLPLTPGRYLVDVGSRSGDAFALDYVPGLCQVEVIPGAVTPSYLVGAVAGLRLAGEASW